MLKLVIYSIYSSGREVRLFIAGAVPLNYENVKLLRGSYFLSKKG
ncbi:hypothetical protein ABIC86_006043 [Paenibacillus sp. DS2363]|nr:hypothetical protein [Paenibacillus xylanexedens]